MSDPQHPQNKFLRVEFLAPPSVGRAAVIASWPRILVGDRDAWTVLELKANARELAVLLTLSPEGLLARDIGRALAARPDGVVPHDGGRSARDGARRNLLAALDTAGVGALIDVPTTRGRTSATYSLKVATSDLDEFHKAVAADDTDEAARLSHDGMGWLRGLSVSGGLDDLPHHQPWTASPGKLSNHAHGQPANVGFLPQDLLARTLNDARWVQARFQRPAAPPDRAPDATHVEGRRGLSHNEPPAPPFKVPHSHPQPGRAEEDAPSIEPFGPPPTNRRHARRRRSRLAASAVATGAVVAAIPIGISMAGGEKRASAPASVASEVTARAADLQPAYRVYAGGPARTWSDFTIAGGRPGPQVVTTSGVDVTCRTDGFVVPDGNRWWYLIASPPWKKQFWVTADAFYNRPGVSSGSLEGTPFFDQRIPVCP